MEDQGKAMEEAAGLQAGPEKVQAPEPPDVLEQILQGIVRAINRPLMNDAQLISLMASMICKGETVNIHRVVEQAEEIVLEVMKRDVKHKTQHVNSPAPNMGECMYCDNMRVISKYMQTARAQRIAVPEQRIVQP